jgi:hypothetical protein
MRPRGTEPSAPGAAVPTKTGAKHVVLAIAAAWLLSLGFDLFLHGGLLASLYLEPGPFLLPPEEAFRRIPFGYLTFLILTASLSWLLLRLGVRGAAEGFRYGLTAGFVLWGAHAIGLYSISTASWQLLAGWWLGQALELGLAGAVLGAAAGGMRLKRIWLLVIVVVIICVVVTITLQSIGSAPAVKVAL